jgi:hypothetical protein
VNFEQRCAADEACEGAELLRGNRCRHAAESYLTHPRWLF